MVWVVGTIFGGAVAALVLLYGLVVGSLVSDASRNLRKREVRLVERRAKLEEKRNPKPTSPG